MKIAIGTPHLTTNSSHEQFNDSLISLIDFTKSQGHKVDRINTYRDNITFARNKIASQALKGNYDYLFFLDDDMVFEPDLLVNLMKLEADIASGLCFLRREPHEPSMFNLAKDGRSYNPVVIWNTGDLIKCDAVGMACTLISKNVLKAIAENSEYYKTSYAFFDNAYHQGEDMRFCRKAKDLGFTIVCDTRELVGHIVEKVISYGDFASFVENRNKDTLVKMETANYEKQIRSQKSS